MLMYNLLVNTIIMDARVINRFLGDNQGMTLVGWASDGFPVYARYGYIDPNDSTSELISLQPSWRLKKLLMKVGQLL